MNKELSINNITAKEKQFFHENGYLIKRNFIDLKQLSEIQKTVVKDLINRQQPYELEQEVNYPGSPKTKSEQGGDTIRRLKMAYTRDDVFENWAKDENVKHLIMELFQSESLFVVQSHHNCIMTKQPQYSSETHWHKDIRYWNFENNQLINTWLPLGDETLENGCLQVIPKTHLWKTPKDRLDKRLFLRKDLVENQKWLGQAINVELKKGDLLFFHAALFHAAGRNTTPNSKNAVVFTYHSEMNKPFPETNSVRFSEVKI